MALNGVSWQLGFIVGPALGAVILGAKADAPGSPQPRCAWAQRSACSGSSGLCRTGRG
jgi:hypothetical protein